MSKKTSFNRESARMTLSLALLIVATPLVVPSEGMPFPLALFGWAMIGTGLLLPVWTRLASSFEFLLPRAAKTLKENGALPPAHKV